MTIYTINLNAKAEFGRSSSAEEHKGSLEQITNWLIDQNYRWEFGADLSADYWPYLYWSDPDAWDLDDDEQPPARPDYTVEIVTKIASRVWDVPERWIALTEN